MDADGPDGLVDSATAATLLGVPVRTVRYRCAHGLLPGARRIGRDWVIPLAAVGGARGAGRPRPGPKPRRAGDPHAETTADAPP